MNEKQIKFGEDLIAAIIDSFEKAYILHKRGESHAALLIQYDIYVAAHDFAPEIVRAHRTAIASAVDACDKGVPMFMARTILSAQLFRKFKEIVDEG